MDDRLGKLVASFKNEKDREFIQEALELQHKAEAQAILLRLLGSLAFRLQCPGSAAHLEALQRRITDIDFAASSTHRNKLQAFFGNLGYAIDDNALYLGGGHRYIFINTRNGNHIDVFFDRLEMCHTVEFKDRLNLDCHTLSLADLLLEKMQIVAISMKDFKDTAVLMLEHEVGTEDNAINMEYITHIMRNDWGFFHTFVTNLNRLQDVLHQFHTFDEKERAIINDRIEQVLAKVTSSPKSLRWKVRARIGTRIRWYRQVD